MVATPVLTKQYVEQRSGGYWVMGTRTSLDSVIYAFLSGASPESIVQSFPLLTPEQVYGVITFYLANQELIDNYLKEGEDIFRELQQTSRIKNADLYAKLGTARENNL